MSKHLQILRETIQQLTLENPKQRDILLQSISSLDSELKSAMAALETSEKERKLATQYLNDTILDLEKNHKQLKEANKFLSHQNEIIDNNLQKLIFAYEELEQFTYIASHDLKSPLRTIASYAQLLKAKYSNDLDSKANEYLDLIISSMHNMKEVINESLAYSSIGKEGTRRTNPVSLNKVIEIVKVNLATEIKESAAVIKYDELPTIIGRKTNFIQLFQNLISNSIKYKSELDPFINIKSKPIDEGWQIEVVDNGKGIDKKYHQIIFQPFKRIDNENLSGAGLGLAISKKICTMYNGTIDIQSSESKGTSVILSLQDLTVS